MKFGRNLPRNQVPEWASHYINYKALKKLIKTVAESSNAGGQADTAEFFYSLDRNLEDVDDFYNKKYGDLVRRLKLLQDQYGSRTGNGGASTLSVSELDRDEADDLMGALLELRGSLRKLQWYGEVNRRGFIKITKKLDKKVPGVGGSQRSYLESKVDLKAFTTNSQLLKTKVIVNGWLSKLGDSKILKEESLVTNGAGKSTQRTSKTSFSLAPGQWEKLDATIKEDEEEKLRELLQEVNLSEEERKNPPFQKLMLELLQRAISTRAKKSILVLLQDMSSLDEPEDMNQRNCIHRLIISISRVKASDQETSRLAVNGTHSKDNDSKYITPATPPNLAPSSSTFKELETVAVPGKHDDAVVLLQFLLDNLKPQQRPALTAKDVYGRLPLHYAAQYGFVVVCGIIIARMTSWGQLDFSHGIDTAFWLDSEGYAPLHLSVIGGHPLTTKALLQASNHSDSQTLLQGQISKSGEILILATKAGSAEIVKLLLDANVNINFQDEHGETAAHVAARFGHVDCLKVLLDGSGAQRPDLEIAEKTFSWTPLFIASVDGHLDIVELLIEADVRLDGLDSSGWSAKEHAALRGHISIAKTIAEKSPPPSLAPPDILLAASSPPTSHSLVDRTSNGVSNGSGSTPASVPVKTFGHRYLTDQSMILVSLGSMDARKGVEAVKLDRIPLASAHSTQLDTALSIVVSAIGATGEPFIVDLPVQDNISTEPIAFHTSDPTKVKLLFDIVPTYAGSKEQIVGRGVALLSSVKPSIGSKRITLQGDVSVPIIAARNLEVIGCVNFNFLIVTPFSHPNMSITANQTYWKSMSSTMVIGHRGFGKNAVSRRSLQLGENTIQSFIAAANLGASYVEFDVQLTKDHVPVIYHDFLVSETGIDAPVHTLTLEQFMHVNDSRTPRVSRPPSPTLLTPNGSATDLTPKSIDATARRIRSMSTGANNEKEDSKDAMSERMKHTKDFKKKGFKANSRGRFIQAPFTTLEEMFKKLPESIGFNIEMKYPMLHESEEQEMDTYAVELNSFVDTVLDLVYSFYPPAGTNGDSNARSLNTDTNGALKDTLSTTPTSRRPIIFSSFHPSICLLLSLKQPSIPVLFLTDAGTCPVGDIRASSLQEAIRFASRWNLLGVVSSVEPFLLAPRLIRVVKDSGLVCVSYGEGNDQEEGVRRQVREGIDAVIVDKVLGVRGGLRG
ncbi:Glycerophosphocholine phosphodiesterase [Agyrium rufum]|nr:Glycerophosphocholine phosphodiesterase [Agyrium rufum]